MSDWSLRRFVRCSLEILRVECPQAYWRLSDILRNLTLVVRVDMDQVAVLFDGEGARVVDEPENPTVIVAAGKTSILDIVEARVSLSDAVGSGVIELAGPVDDLALFFEALRIYVHGAVRSPSFPPLLERFRDSTMS